MTQDPIPRNRDATNLRILDAAFVVLSDDGFARFGVNCVARAAGCDKKLIYRYFDGIDGLLGTMGLSVADGLVAALVPHQDPKPGTYAAMMERLGLALFDHPRADPRYGQIKLLELSAARRQPQVSGPPGAKRCKTGSWPRGVICNRLPDWMFMRSTRCRSRRSKV